MDHKGTVTLRTDRLILRRFVMDDAGAMYENWASEDAVTEYLTWPAHESVDVTRAVIADWIRGYERADFYQWAIELKELGQVIGSISVTAQNPAVAGCELGWCMGSAWWGRGIMPEAGRAVLRYLFDEVGFARAGATHAAGNPKSGRVMQKLGMRYEGALRQAGRCNQGVIDEVRYAILKDEFPSDEREAFRPMRRSRQALRPEETEAILEHGTTAVLAVNGDGGYPYAVPVNYVWKDGKIYFHGARAGHKFDALVRDSRVSLCVVARDEPLPEKLTDLYRSAIVFGRARLLSGQELADAAYALGMRFLPDPDRVRQEIAGDADRLACFELTPEHVTGKEAIELTRKRGQDHGSD